MNIAKKPILGFYIDFLKKHIEEILCILCFAIVMYILLQIHQPMNQVILGHDSAYHYLRLEAASYNIENGTLFSGVDHLFLNGAGYASSAAYPDILLLFPAFLRTLGVSVGTSMSVHLILCDIFTYLTMFLCAKALTGSPVGGTIAAVAYTLCQYRLDNIFIRMALGEIQAFIFWPLILYGLYDLIFCDFKKPYILGIGFTGMLLSHVISTIFSLIISILFVLIFIRRILKQPHKIVKLLITAGIVMIATSFYWIPLLELVNSCELGLTHNAFLASNFPLKFYNLFRDVYAGGDGPSLGIPIFFFCILRIFITKHSPIYQTISAKSQFSKYPDVLVIADTFTLGGIFLSILATDLMPWEKLKFLDFMQFPWRLLGVASTLILLAGAVYLFYLLKFNNAKNIGMIVATAVVLLCSFVHIDGMTINRLGVYPDEFYTSQPDTTYSIGMAEYLPINAQNNIDVLHIKSNQLTLENGDTCSFERTSVNSLSFTTTESDKQYAEIHYIWYKGYDATDENGNKLSVTMSKTGFVAVKLPDGSHTITVTYHATLLRTICNWVSLLGVLTLFGIFCFKTLKRKLKEQHNI